MPLSKSKIGYDGDHLSWNPGGAACSNKCDGCWSLAKVGPRMKCKKCQDNIVHLHEERLGDPASRKKPATILVNFTCDTFDQKRECMDVQKIVVAAYVTGDSLARQHQYIWLTKNVKGMAGWAKLYPHANNFWWGLSIRNQADADAKLPIFLQIPGKLWISYEPAWGPVNWGFGENMGPGEDSAVGWTPCDVGGTRHQHPIGERCSRGLEGMIIGHDNRKGAPGTDTLDHIRSTVEQCKDVGVRCYVKQVWRSYCDCGDVYDGVYEYGICSAKLKPRLLTDPNDFPEDLRIRDLPWGEKEQG